MTQTNLKVVLQSMVREHGFEKVHEQLHSIQISEPPARQPRRSSAPSVEGSSTRKTAGKSKPTAPQYVAKMELSLEKEQLLGEIAGRFQEKLFLPTFGDIVHFCQFYSIDVPASKSRSNAIPRVFKFIASMETDDVQQMLDDGMFSGPSRLGPIADAIRRNGRVRTAAFNSGTLVPSDNA